MLAPSTASAMPMPMRALSFSRKSQAAISVVNTGFTVTISAARLAGTCCRPSMKKAV